MPSVFNGAPEQKAMLLTPAGTVMCACGQRPRTLFLLFAGLVSLDADCARGSVRAACPAVRSSTLVPAKLALGVHQAKVFKGEAADGEEAKTFIRDAQVLMCLCACACAGAHHLFVVSRDYGRVAAGWQQRYLHALADLTLRAGEHHLPLWLRGWRKISCVRGVLF